MRVQVRRVSAMPHNVQIWVDDEDDEPDRFLMLIHEELLTEQGALLLESLLNFTVQHWARKAEPQQRITLHSHTG